MPFLRLPIVSGSSGPTGSYTEVANYASLPAPATETGEIFVVLNSSGIWPLRRSAGFYYSTGSSWSYLGDFDPAFIKSLYESNSDTNAYTDAEQAAVATISSKQDVITGPNNSAIVKNSSGIVVSAPEMVYNSFSLIEYNKIDEVADNESHTLINNQIELNATENAANTSVNVVSTSVRLDTQDDGFEQGTTGQALTIHNTFVEHENKSDVGQIVFNNNYIELGNETDPIEVNGLGYYFAFSNIRQDVTLSGPIQGYVFQPTVDAGAEFGTGSYITAFGDFGNYAPEAPIMTSFSASPVIDTTRPSAGYTGVNVNPTIDNLESGTVGVGVYGQYGTFDESAYYHGVGINPTIDSARYAAAINVSMDSVTPYPGVSASVVIQDLTITFNQANAFDNSYTIEYTTGATAGSEVVAIAGTDIQVQIEDGVSTATQVKTAIEATVGLNAAVTVTISGVGSNAQVAEGPLSFSGGESAGQVLAAYLDGDVQITGGLTFGGALSIGKLNAFHSQEAVNGGGTPTSVHALVSGITVDDNDTIANADTLGINTAMLLQIGDNATVTTGFTGMSALALPAVVTMGSGATLDLAAGATFAVSLDAAASGGTIGELDLCRSVAIPNGVTAITRLVGYKMDLPFGNPGTTSWGVYITPGINNYMAGNLLIGGTPLSDDTVTNSSVGLEIKSTEKAMLLSRMTSTERDALTAVNGMVIYNTTTNKFQGYEGGAWVNLI